MDGARLEMNAIEEKALRALASRGEGIEARELSEAGGVPYATLMSALVGLEERKLVEANRTALELAALTDEGMRYAEFETPERRLANAVKGEELLENAVARAGLTEKEKGIALQWGIKEGLFRIGKRDGKTFLVAGSRGGETVVEKVLRELRETKLEANGIDKKVFEVLKSRKLAEVVRDKKIELRITAAGLKALEHVGAGEENQLTPQMLRDGSWKGKRFKEYDLRSVVAPVAFGKKHAYLDFLYGIKQKLVGLGFKEVHGPFVETEFWNMDVLFMAQDHPAREIHDVFQIDGPKGDVPKALSERVRKAHEKGLCGSRGWRYRWSPEIAARLVLRSQTTAVSARYLAKRLPTPLRIFCIGKVFRPDEIDWKHFIEFNQCEGIVADESMNFRDLLGYLKDFAKEIFGAEDAKFVPSYFPFTEPSVELLAKIPGRGWAEVGGAGMFRPEMLAALETDVPVLAWGLGIDRLAMISLDVKDIRDLASHDVEFLKSK